MYLGEDVGFRSLLFSRWFFISFPLSKERVGYMTFLYRRQGFKVRGTVHCLPRRWEISLARCSLQNEFDRSYEWRLWRFSIDTNDHRYRWTDYTIVVSRSIYRAASDRFPTCWIHGDLLSFHFAFLSRIYLWTPNHIKSFNINWWLFCFCRTETATKPLGLKIWERNSWKIQAKAYSSGNVVIHSKIQITIVERCIVRGISK